MYWQRQLKQRVNRKHTQQMSRENKESRKQMKSNNSPYELLLVIKKQASPPIKKEKTKQVLGIYSFGENLGGGDKYKDTNQT